MKLPLSEVNMVVSNTQTLNLREEDLCSAVKLFSCLKLLLKGKGFCSARGFFLLLVQCFFPSFFPICRAKDPTYIPSTDIKFYHQVSTCHHDQSKGIS